MAQNLQQRWMPHRECHFNCHSLQLPEVAMPIFKGHREIRNIPKYCFLTGWFQSRKGAFDFYQNPVQRMIRLLNLLHHGDTDKVITATTKSRGTLKKKICLLHLIITLILTTRSHIVWIILSLLKIFHLSLACSMGGGMTEWLFTLLWQRLARELLYPPVSCYVLLIGAFNFSSVEPPMFFLILCRPSPSGWTWRARSKTPTRASA